MQIELIGCTSAGKSTLAREILLTCREQGLDIFSGEDFVLKQLRLNWIKSQVLRKFLVNLAALLAALAAWRDIRTPYLFATQLLSPLPLPRVERLNLLRNVLKKLGIDAIVRARRTGQQIILLDEGALHIAHNLFVHVAAGPPMDAIPAFVKSIPLPDFVVYLRQPESTLIERIVKRGHSRIANLSHENAAVFVRRAVATFDTLVQEPAVQNRLLVVDGARRVTTFAGERDDPAVDLASGIIRTLGFEYVA
jgi:thymidylate kinase